MNQTITRASQPLPPGADQDQVLKAVTDELSDRGFVVAQLDIVEVGKDALEAERAVSSEGGWELDDLQLAGFQKASYMLFGGALLRKQGLHAVRSVGLRIGDWVADVRAAKNGRVEAEMRRCRCAPSSRVAKYRVGGDGRADRADGRRQAQYVKAECMCCR